MQTKLKLEEIKIPINEIFIYFAAPSRYDDDL